MLVGLSCISVANLGQTQAASCGGIAGLECSEGQYCDYSATATCGEGDQAGQCLVTPDFCKAQFLPVCGCDGAIYSNSCVAAAAGVNVATAAFCMNSSSETAVQILNCQDGASPQVIVCAEKDGDIQEYPNPCAAETDGAMNIVARTGDSCAVSR
ncbi:Kazal-type serine protease inhibitor domain-containing protein [uncultured Jannaschia sp.]|uniref:Kazal-type serine protease inhibitor domain-containing protein n=1 Tax=uncultured Jannaschia sp. TaxID=293347 RepID=UPI0034383F45